MDNLDDPDSQSMIMIQLMLIVFLTLLNAFFAAAEIALVSLNKNRISQLAGEGHQKARLLEKLIADPSKFIATIQVGITFAGLFSSASASTGLANHFASILGNIPYAKEISIVIITCILSYVTLVFGELFPKRIALQNAERIAMFSVKPILFISKITLPFVKFLSFSTNVLLRMMGMNHKNEAEKVSREEIKLLAQAGQADGTIDAEELKMIKGVFAMDNKIVREIMTPRTNAFAVSIHTPSEKLADLLLSENYSRIPVFEKSNDIILGILYLRDYFTEARKVGFDKVEIQPLLREPFFVPETKFVDDLLKELQTTQNHLAVVIDEYGGFSGIVSIEDLLEEIVGEIDDEYDEIQDELTRLDENIYIAKGTLLIHDFNEHFSTNIQISTVDTISGFILDRIGKIPEKGDRIVVEYDQILFTVESIENNRLEKIRIEKKRPVKKEVH